MKRTCSLFDALPQHVREWALIEAYDRWSPGNRYTQSYKVIVGPKNGWQALLARHIASYEPHPAPPVRCNRRAREMGPKE